MRHLPIYLAAILWALAPGLAFSNPYLAVIAKRRSSAPPPPSGGLHETFEGSSSDSLGTSGYDVTGWVGTIATGDDSYPDPNYTATVVGSGNGLYLRNSTASPYGVGTVTYSFDPSDTFYVYLIIQGLDTASVAGTERIIVITDAADNYLTSVGPDYQTGYLYRDNTGSRAPTGNTTWGTAPGHLWFEYEKETGGGGNAVCRVYYSANSTKPASPQAEFTDGTMDAQAVKLHLRGGAYTYDQHVFDNIKVDLTTPIPSQ